MFSFLTVEQGKSFPYGNHQSNLRIDSTYQLRYPFSGPFRTESFNLFGSLHNTVEVGAHIYYGTGKPYNVDK